MVCIGYPKENKKEDVAQYLLQYELECLETFKIIGELEYVQVRNWNIAVRGLYCFAGWRSVYNETGDVYVKHVYPERRISPFGVFSSYTVKRAFVEDAFMWLWVIHNFANDFGEIGIYCHEEQEPFTGDVIELTTKHIGIDDLLELRTSQILLVKRDEFLYNLQKETRQNRGLA